MNVTVPVYVPGVNEPGVTETVTLPGVLPALGDAESHEPPVTVATESVKLIAAPLLLSATAWLGGNVPLPA